MKLFNTLSSDWQIIPALLLGLLLNGCAGSIDHATLMTRLAEPEGKPALVDVRTGSEYEAGHLPGAVNLPVQSLPFNLPKVPVADRSEPVVVYCSHGPRAGLAGFFLRLGGFSQVLHLQGDFKGWSRAGLPVVAGNNAGIWAE
jgi:rhodanese-related sulfurtransferase